jgi:hypothetical protein
MCSHFKTQVKTEPTDTVKRERDLSPSDEVVPESVKKTKTSISKVDPIVID